MLILCKKIAIGIVSVIRYVLWRILNSSSIEGREIHLADCDIHYRISGAGEPLVLLHGGLTSIEAWLCQLPTLSKAFKVIAIDSRGHGRSSLGKKKLSYRLMADDVLAILDAENIDRVHIAGWSDGGNTGLVLSVFHPERVNKVVAISANYHPDGFRESFKPSVQASPQTELFSLPRWWHWLLTKKNIHHWFDLKRRTHKMWQTYPQLTINDLSHIKSCVLILLGENDLICMTHTREMEEYIPSAQLRIIKNCGHNVLFEEPALVTELIMHFIEG